jgi:hypothetical protein
MFPWPFGAELAHIYIYVVDRDFGFAPNPFHGYCTLATCKPGIRNSAVIGDWVIGLGGSRLRATNHCIYAMRVTSKISFDEYWNSPAFTNKKPVRNGSRKMMVGDNIYHRSSSDRTWIQANSHHSNEDGSSNRDNLLRDTKSEYVLISNYFIYFGRNAPAVPPTLLNDIGYVNRRNYRVFDLEVAINLVKWLEDIGTPMNEVRGDPYDFSSSEKRYSGVGSKLI